MFFRGTLVSLAALAAVLFWNPTQAEACGGFFCNNSQPVNQQAERIIFSQNDDGTVTAIIQILYSGPSESFAWVIPVEGEPEIGVSSNIVFQRLQAQTNPQYTLNRVVEGTCGGDDSFRGGFAAPSAAEGADFSAGADAGQAAPPPVSVVDAGSVGPYDWIAISVDPEAEDIADVAVEWLQDNGYDVDDSGRRTLTPYLMAGMNLVAFRLTKNSDAGSIRPVTITFRTERPGIPILPTAVAAEDDMGIMVWVLGENRAIPENYLHLQLNDALINWFSPGLTYGDVVSAAADEAGGKGFVTEQAGPTSDLQPLMNDWEEPQRSFASSDIDFIVETISQYQTFDPNTGANLFWDGITETLATVPWPEGFDQSQLMSCPWCLSGNAELQTIDGFNKEEFLATLEEEVLAPVRAAQELLDAQPYITRLYTTMSAHEMDRDPLFDFNHDLDDVSNQHNADQVIECSRYYSEFDAPWRIELPSGAVVRGMGSDRTWPFGMDDIAMPANERIERLETTGRGTVVEDNVSAINQALNDYNDTFSGSSRSGGCSVSNASAGASLMLLVGLALLFNRRRKQ